MPAKPVQQVMVPGQPAASIAQQSVVGAEIIK